MSEWAYARLRVGRLVMIAGLWIMPSCRAKRELTQMLDIWSTDVRKAIGRAQ